MLRYVNLLFALTFAVSLWSAEPKSMTIVTDSATALSPQVDLIHDLFSRSEDDTISKKNSVELLEYLKKNGIVQEMIYSSDSSHVSVVPGIAVRDIVIRGAFPLFKSEIERVMTIGSGNFLTEERIQQQVELVTEKLESNGILKPIVKITPVELKKYPGLVNLLVQIDVEQYRKVNSVVYRGSDLYGDIRHGFTFHQWHYKTLAVLPRRYMQEEIRDDIRSLRDFYRFQGYGDVDVSLVDSVLESKPGDPHERVELQLTIEPGTAQRVTFGRLKPLKKRKIKEHFDISKKGNRNGATIKRGTVQMKKQLRSLGYASARVNVTDTTVVRGKRYPWECKYFTVSVEPGTRTAIDSISFKGNTRFKEQELVAVMLTREGRMRKRKSRGTYSPRIFKKDLEQIEKLYKSQGYLTADVHSVVKPTGDSLEQRVAIVVEIDEGPQTRVAQFNIAGIPEGLDSLRDSLLSVAANREDSLFLPLEVFNDRIRMVTKIKQMGFPFAEVNEREEYNEDSTEVTLTYKVNPYHSAIVGNVIYWGNFATKKKLLDRTIEIVTGEPFSLEKLNIGIKELRDLGIFNNVNYSIPDMEKRGDTLDIIVNLEEHKSINISGALGYETDKKVYVKASFLKNNLWGLNKSLLLEAGYSAIEKGGIITFTEPHLFNSDLVFSISVYGKVEHPENVSYTTNLFGNSYTLGYEWRDKVTLSLTTAYEAKRNDGVEGTSIDTSNGGETIVTDSLRHTLNFNPKTTLDGRDSFVRPKKGGVMNGSAKISKGLNVELDNYWKLELEGKYYFTIGQKVTTAFRMRYGMVRQYGENKYIPSDEMFLLGGTGSVRGYEENMLFFTDDRESRAGKYSYDGSIEIRPEIAPNIEIPIFFDFGSLGFENGIKAMESPRSSAGTGFRFLTPIGPIGLVYGWKLDRKESEKRPGAFHFSIGYTF